MKHITILVGQNKIEVYSNQNQEYTITVNGEAKQLIKNKKISLSSDKTITAYLTEDKTVVISSPSSRITHSGKTVARPTAPTAGCAETTTRTRGPTSSPPRNASTSRTASSLSPTAPSPASARLCPSRLSRRSRRRSRSAPSTRPRRPTCPPSTPLARRTATP